MSSIHSENNNRINVFKMKEAILREINGHVSFTVINFSRFKHSLYCWLPLYLLFKAFQAVILGYGSWLIKWSKGNNASWCILHGSFLPLMSSLILEIDLPSRFIYCVILTTLMDVGFSLLISKLVWKTLGSQNC